MCCFAEMTKQFPKLTVPNQCVEACTTVVETIVHREIAETAVKKPMSKHVVLLNRAWLPIIKYGSSCIRLLKM